MKTEVEPAVQSAKSRNRKSPGAGILTKVSSKQNLNDSLRTRASRPPSGNDTLRTPNTNASRSPSPRRK